MQQRSAITYHLARSLNDQEKLQFTKFLSVFGTPSHKNLMDACFKLSEFDDNLLWKHSKIKSRNHYRKIKSESKDFILEFLRVNALHSRESNCRKQIDYAEVFKIRGDKLSEEGYKILRKLTEEIHSKGYGHYLFISLKELSWFVNRQMGKNTEKLSYVTNLMRDTLRANYQGFFILEFYHKVAALASQSYCIKSHDRECQLLDLANSEFYHLDVRNVISVSDKISLVAAQMLINKLLSRTKRLRKSLEGLQFVFEDDNPKYKTALSKPEHRAIYYQNLMHGYAELGDWNNLSNLAEHFKTYITENFSQLGPLNYYWAYYYDMYHYLKINGNQPLEKNDLVNLLSLKKQFEEHLPSHLSLSFNISCMILAFKCGDFKTAAVEAHATLDTEKNTTVRHDLIEFTRYLLPIIQLASLLNEEEQTAITWEYFKNTATTQYEYFRKKEKKYYQLEIRVTGFLKTLNKPVNQAETLEILDQLKCRIQEAEANDYLNQVKEIQRHFNLYEWIDKEKHRLLNQFRRSA